MTFQPLAIAAMMKCGGRGSDSLNWTVYLSGAVISLTARNRMLRGMLTPVRRLPDAVERRLDVLRGQLGAVVELHALAQMEGIGLAVLGDLPAMRQVGDDRPCRRRADRGGSGCRTCSPSSRDC